MIFLSCKVEELIDSLSLLLYRIDVTQIEILNFLFTLVHKYYTILLEISNANLYIPLLDYINLLFEVNFSMHISFKFMLSVYEEFRVLLDKGIYLMERGESSNYGGQSQSSDIGFFGGGGP